MPNQIFILFRNAESNVYTFQKWREYILSTSQTTRMHRIHLDEILKIIENGIANDIKK